MQERLQATVIAGEEDSRRVHALRDRLQARERRYADLMSILESMNATTQDKLGQIDDEVRGTAVHLV